jgi:hypothetical protein
LSDNCKFTQIKYTLAFVLPLNGYLNNFM